MFERAGENVKAIDRIIPIQVLGSIGLSQGGQDDRIVYDAILDQAPVEEKEKHFPGAQVELVIVGAQGMDILRSQVGVPI
jgi:hypothetical protein